MRTACSEKCLRVYEAQMRRLSVWGLRMKVLMLCGEIPFPPHGGSRMRVYQFIRALSERHAITLLAYSYTDDERATIEELTQWCRVQTVRWQEPELLARMRLGSPITSQLAY